MSFLHCPTCSCAYNIAREPACPRCGVRAGAPADPADDIVSAVEQLARAMARATPIDLITARSVLDARTSQLALPAPGQPAGAPSPALLRAVRTALDAPSGDGSPASEPRGVRSRLERLFEHLSPERRASWRAALDAMLARLAPRLPARSSAPVSRAQAMFLFAKSQLTRLHQASMNFGRALR